MSNWYEDDYPPESPLDEYDGYGTYGGTNADSRFANAPESDPWHLSRARGVPARPRKSGFDPFGAGDSGTARQVYRTPSSFDPLQGMRPATPQNPVPKSALAGATDHLNINTPPTRFGVSNAAYDIVNRQIGSIGSYNSPEDYYRAGARAEGMNLRRSDNPVFNPSAQRFVEGGAMGHRSVSALQQLLGQSAGERFQIGGLEWMDTASGREQGFFISQTIGQGDRQEQQRFWTSVDPVYGGVRVAPEDNMSGFWATTADYRGGNRMDAFGVMQSAVQQGSSLTRFLSGMDVKDRDPLTGEGTAAWKRRDTFSPSTAAQWGFGAGVFDRNLSGEAAGSAIQQISRDTGTLLYGRGGSSHLFPQQSVMESMLPQRQRFIGPEPGTEGPANMLTEFMVSSTKRPQGFLGEFGTLHDSIGSALPEVNSSFRLGNESEFQRGVRVTERRDLFSTLHNEGQVQTRNWMQGVLTDDKSYKMTEGALQIGDVFGGGNYPIQEGYRQAGSVGDLKSILGTVPSGQAYIIEGVNPIYENDQYTGQSRLSIRALGNQMSFKRGSKEAALGVSDSALPGNADIWGALPSEKDLPTYAVQTLRARYNQDSISPLFADFAMQEYDKYQAGESRYGGFFDTLKQTRGEHPLSRSYFEYATQDGVVSPHVQELFTGFAVNDLMGRMEVSTYEDRQISNLQMDALMRSRIGESAAKMSPEQVQAEYFGERFQQYNRMSMNGQDFDILTNPVRQDDGTWRVGEFRTPSITTENLVQPRPESVRDRHLVSTEHLDWMRYGNEGAYNALVNQMVGNDPRRGGAISNEAQSMAIAMNANVSSAARSKMSSAGLAPDFDPVMWENARAGIDASGMTPGEAQIAQLQAYGTAQQEQLKAQGITNPNTGIRMPGGVIAPSADALSRIATLNDDGNLVKKNNPAAAWFQSFEMAANLGMAGANMDPEGKALLQAQLSEQLGTATSETGDYLGNETAHRRAFGAEVPTVGGIAHGLPGLAENEAILSLEHAQKVTGMSRKELREMTNYDKLGDSDKQLSVSLLGYPFDAPHFAAPSMRVKWFEDEIKNKDSLVSRSGIVNPGQNMLVSEAAAFTMHRDFDADYTFGFFNYMKNKAGELLGGNTGFISPEEVRRRAEILPESEYAKSYEKMESRADPATYMANVYSKLSDDLWKSPQAFNEEYMQALSTKGEIGPAYNVMLRQMFKGAMEFTDESGLGGSAIAARRSEAFSLMGSRAYQGPLDMKADQDPHMKNIMDATRYMDWSTKTDGSVAPFGKIQYNDEERKFQPAKNIGSWEGMSRFLVDELAKVGSDMDEEEYRQKFAPSIADALLPSNRAASLIDSGELESSQETFKDALQSFRGSKTSTSDFYRSVAEYTGSWHPKQQGTPMLSTLMTGGESGDLGDMAPFLAVQMGATMERHFEKGRTNRPGFKGADKAHDIYSRVKEYNEAAIKKGTDKTIGGTLKAMGRMVAGAGRDLMGLFTAPPDETPVAPPAEREVAAPEGFASRKEQYRATLQEAGFSEDHIEAALDRVESESSGYTSSFKGGGGGRSQWEGITPPGGGNGSGGGDFNSPLSGDDMRPSGGGGDQKFYTPRMIPRSEQEELKKQYALINQYVNADETGRAGMNAKQVWAAAKNLPTKLDQANMRMDFFKKQGWHEREADDVALGEWLTGAKQDEMRTGMETILSDPTMMQGILSQAERKQYTSSYRQQRQLQSSAQTWAAREGLKGESGGDDAIRFVGEFKDALGTLAKELQNTNVATKDQIKLLKEWSGTWEKANETAVKLQQSTGMSGDQLTALGTTASAQGYTNKQIAEALNVGEDSPAVGDFRRLYSDDYGGQRKGLMGYLRGDDGSQSEELEDQSRRLATGELRLKESNAQKAFRGVVGSYYAMSAAKQMFGEIVGGAEQDMQAAAGFQDTFAVLGGGRGSMYRTSLARERNQIKSGMVAEEMYGGIFGMDRSMQMERFQEGAKLTLGLGAGSQMIGAALEGAGFGNAAKVVGQAGMAASFLTGGLTVANAGHNWLSGQMGGFDNYSQSQTAEVALQSAGRIGVGLMGGIGRLGGLANFIPGGGAAGWATKQIMSSPVGEWLGTDLENQARQEFANKYGATMDQLDFADQNNLSLQDYANSARGAFSRFGAGDSSSFLTRQVGVMAGTQNISAEGLMQASIGYGSQRNRFSVAGQYQGAVEYSVMSPVERVRADIYQGATSGTRDQLATYLGDEGANQWVDTLLGGPNREGLDARYYHRASILGAAAMSSVPYGGTALSAEAIGPLSENMTESQVGRFGRLRALSQMRGFGNENDMARTVKNLDEFQGGRYESLLGSIAEMGFSGSESVDRQAASAARALSGGQIGGLQNLLGQYAGIGLTSEQDYGRANRLAMFGAGRGTQVTDAASRYLQSFTQMGIDSGAAAGMSETFAMQAYNPAAQNRVLGMSGQLFGMGVNGASAANAGLLTAGMSNMDFTRTQKFLSGDPYMGSIFAGTAMGQSLGLKPTVDVNTGLGIFQEEQWGLQQASAALSYQSQMFSVGQQRQQLSISNAFNFGGTYTDPRTGKKQSVANGGQYGIAAAQFEQGIEQAMFGFDMGWRQHNLGDEKQQWEFGLQQRQWDRSKERQQKDFSLQERKMNQQYEWSVKDWTYSENQAQLGFGWQMEDMDRGIKYARGRDRIDLERQKRRAVISESMRSEHSEDQRGRIDTQFEWQKEALELQKKYYSEDKEMQEERLKKEREFYERSKQLQEERMKKEREFYDRNLPLQKQLKEMQEEQAKISAEMQKRSIDHSAAIAAAQYGIQQREMQISQEITRRNAEMQMFWTVTFPEMVNGGKINIQQLFDIFGAEANKIIGSLASQGNSMAQAIQGTQNLFSSLFGNKKFDGGYVSGWPGFAEGGFTGRAGKYQPVGVVHGGEYVIPQEGSPVVRGDNPETVKLLRDILKALNTIAGYGPGNVKQTIIENHGQRLNLDAVYTQ